MDSIFVEGVAATISALVIFCGSVMLLLTMVLGIRLAYLVTASVTLAFLFIMGVVWSLPAASPLGPVGTLPEWEETTIAEDTAALDFGPAQEYPDGDWRAPDEEDDVELAKAADLGTSAMDSLEAAIDDGTVEQFEESSQAVVGEDTTRLIEVDGKEYGAVTFEPIPLEPEATPTPGDEGEEFRGLPTPAPSATGPPPPPEDARAFVVMGYDPGNPLGPARLITIGILVALIGHLLLLGATERRTRRLREERSTV